ncbi:MAG: bi-domain-containing oxidoreductase [Gammaproteobacteria bacterium]
MKIVLNSLRDGHVTLEDVPAPATRRGEVLIASHRSLISAGTERMLVDFGRSSWIAKARSQPDKVRQVLDKIRTDGLAPTFQAVRNKLDQPLAMGYCNMGVVLEVGAGVQGFAVGDRVASNGKHAEVVAVPQNLCARVPDGVGDDAAAFTVLGAIALQGIRLLAPTLGECVVVTGLGLIGLLTVQLLRAQGCRVLGIDFDPAKLALAERFGAEVVDPGAGGDVLAVAAQFSRGRGVDGVILTASTKSSEPVHQAAQMCRKRGRIVLVGVAGLELSRADFYDKELSFQVSCSYGPGRYDPRYEEQGHDYPVGFVRWTEQRNFEAVLDMLASGHLDVAPLVSHRYAIDDAAAAYDLIAGDEPSLGVLLEYPREAVAVVERSVVLSVPAAAGAVTAGFIGSGNYAGQVLIPAFAATPARLHGVCSAAGVSATRIGRQFGMGIATTDPDAIIADPTCNLVVVATRHDSHADYACRVLAAGKHVFVEKPLALDQDGLDAVRDAYQAAGDRLVMVGFNRRFAPQVVELKRLLGQVTQPAAFVMTVNAGAIAADHWTQDPAVGGGRIVGEACHFVDLLRFLAGSPVSEVSAHALRKTGEPVDSVSATLAFANGAIGTVHYLANGNKGFPKERLEVFAGGGVIVLDNFRDMQGYGWPGFRRMKIGRQDKGQRACVAAFVGALERGEVAPIPFDELLEVHEVTLRIASLAGA